MLELTFFKTQEPTTLSVSEDNYKRLAEVGLSKVVNYADYIIVIEEDEYEIHAVKLDFDNRTKLIRLIELERQLELERLFASMDDSPTIKEMREKFHFVKVLTEIVKLLKNEDVQYFSYD